MDYLDLKTIKEYQENILTGRGNRDNFNHWNMKLAKHFPTIMEEDNGVPTIIEFLGKRYTIEES